MCDSIKTDISINTVVLVRSEHREGSHVNDKTVKCTVFLGDLRSLIKGGMRTCAEVTFFAVSFISYKG